MGRHIEYIVLTDPNKLENLLIYLIPGQVLYLTSITCSKIAILGLYLRIFIGKTSRHVVCTLIAFTTAAWVALVPVAFLRCTPFEANYDLDFTTTTCINQQRFYQLMSLPNIITDIVILFLPIPILMHIQMSVAQKIGLGFSFSLGSM